MMENIRGNSPSDPVVIDFVSHLVVEIAATSNALSEVKLRLLDSPEASTTPLPGEFLVVRSGLIARSETAAEFAAVLAHSMAHLAAGHGRPDSSVGFGQPASAIPVVFLGGWNGICARMSGSTLPSGFLARWRELEEQADLLALQYLDQACYDPGSLAPAFDRLLSADSPVGLMVSSTVREKAREYLANGRMYVTNASAFDDIRRRLEKGVAQR